MTRSQRGAHVRVWAVVFTLILSLFAAGLIARERVIEAADAAKRVLASG